MTSGWGAYLERRPAAPRSDTSAQLFGKPSPKWCGRRPKLYRNLVRPYAPADFDQTCGVGKRFAFLPLSEPRFASVAGPVEATCPVEASECAAAIMPVCYQSDCADH